MNERRLWSAFAAAEWPRPEVRARGAVVQCPWDDSTFLVELLSGAEAMEPEELGEGDDGAQAGLPPCWEVRVCIPEARDRCRAFHDRSRPCWEQVTLCKEMLGIDSCFACEVYKRGRAIRPGEGGSPPFTGSG